MCSTCEERDSLETIVKLVCRLPQIKGYSNERPCTEAGCDCVTVGEVLDAIQAHVGTYDRQGPLRTITSGGLSWLTW